MTISQGIGSNGPNGFKGNVPDLQEIHDCFIQLAKEAGDMITGATPLVNSVGSKKNSASCLFHSTTLLPWPLLSVANQLFWIGSDLVTETDRAVEKMVSTVLQSKYPECEYVLHRPRLYGYAC